MKNKFLKKSAAAAMALAMSVMTAPLSAYADDDYYFNNSFESDSEDWKGRGEASVKNDNGSLFVSGRTDNWNGAEITLDPSVFISGNTYSFGCAVMQDSETSASMKMTLQYSDSSNTANYDEIATVTANNGEWTILGNPSYTIPADASDLVLYVESPDSMTDFYIDNAFAAEKGKELTLSEDNSQQSENIPNENTQQTANVSKWGDANVDSIVSMADSVTIMQALANPDTYQLTDQGSANADVNLTGNGITNADALSIQKYMLGSVENLPESYTEGWNQNSNQSGGNTEGTKQTNSDTTALTTTTVTTTTISETTTTVTTTSVPDINEFTPFNYEEFKQYKAAPDYYYNPCQQQGKVTKENYNGIRGNKSLYVYTPYNYDPSKKYNIFYLMHGGGENENTLFFQNDTMIQNLLDNMIMNGELEPLIVVTPTFNGGGGEAGNFYEELRQSVIPFVEGKYSTYAESTSGEDIAASRMHRAYGGFSMGSVSTWAVFQNDLDIVGYFMPLSGDHWQGEGADGKARSLASAVDKFGMNPNQYFIFAATGSNDIAYPNVNPQVDAMKKLSQFKFTSDFSKGNFYFMVAQGNEHWWGQVRNYVYDALPYFFHESGK